MSGIHIPDVCENYVYRRALRHLEKNRVIIFAGGTGNSYFTTDTGAALRASEMQCDALFKATQVDGVYDSDPRQNSGAQRYTAVTYDEVINRQLKVMDTAAVAWREKTIFRLSCLPKKAIKRWPMPFRDREILQSLSKRYERYG